MKADAKPRIYAMPFARIYPLYLAKVERKGRSKAEVDAVIAWHTGYAGDSLAAALDSGIDCEAFFDRAPALNPNRDLVKGLICGVRVEAIEAPTMREIRILDKLVDELANGRPLEKILRRPA
ncbi:MAG: DUF2200 domain-containing protein [Novosphingobium sp.]